MGSISALHGITLSAWAFAGLTGNQLAAFIVSKVGTPEAATNPVGYQTVLYVTLALYIVALFLSLVFVRPTDKALEAKAAKKVSASMKKDELIAFANENNIAIDEKATKAVIIEAIEAALK
jgi:hypothetical protein